MRQHRRATVVEHEPVVGFAIGSVERRFGLMASRITVRITEQVATSGDLAVADRMAFITALERHAAVVVVQHAGSYHACIVDNPILPECMSDFIGDNEAPRLMSIATDRGIHPVLGPLAAIGA